ncbi:hypothetical protein Tsubulata_001270, partial [Turnera subulata]
MGYKALYTRLMQLWKPGTALELVDLGHGCYLAKFNSLADLERVVTRGPWLVQDHYLTVRQWFPTFRPDNDHIVKTMAWVRLPGLPLQYYNDDLLTTFASGIGKPPWKDTLIVRLLGKTMGYKALYTRLMQLWKPGAALELVDLGHGCYLAKFSSLADLERVVTRGPWLVQDHYLTVRQWFPTFRPDNDHIVKTMAWVRLPGLPLQYYNDDLLTTFATGIGKPVKINSNTSLASHALYALMCVEIDLSQPLVPLVSTDEEVFKVQYEGLHVICLNCGRYGHKTVQCQFDALAEPFIPVEIVEPENYMEVSSVVVPTPVVPRVSAPMPAILFGGMVGGDTSTLHPASPAAF